MKSRSFIGRFVLILLLAAAFFVVSCSSSDEKNNKVFFGSGSDEDTDDDADTANDNDSADSADEDADATQDESDSADDSDSANDDDSDTADSGTTDGDTDTADETDTDFEKEAEGCTMIEVPQITVGGAYADEVDGFFSLLGDNTIDFIQIMLLGERKTGEYELGTGMNETYKSCKQCVLIWVDAAEGVANEYYFQTSGTLEITKVATVDEIERTSGEIRRLILKQVRPTSEHLEDFEFIPEGGKCLAVRLVEWDTTGGSGY